MIADHQDPPHMVIADCPSPSLSETLERLIAAHRRMIRVMALFAFSAGFAVAMAATAALSYFAGAA